MLNSVGLFSPPAAEHVLRALRRWALVVVFGALVAGLAAFLVSRTIEPEYQSTAQLYIAPASNPTVAFQDVVLGTNVARSYVQLVTSEVVLRPAMERVGWVDLKTFEERSKASQVRDTSIITISFRDTSPARSAAAANGIAESFITQTQALQSTLQGTTVSELETQIASVTADIRSLDQEIAALRLDLLATPRPGVSQVPKADLQAQLSQIDSSRQAKQQTLAQLLKTRDDMQLAAVRAQSTVSLWQRATEPSLPVLPRVGLNTALGTAAGALLTLLLILVIGYVDDRITTSEEVQSRLGVTALGQVSLGDHPETTQGKLYVRDLPRSPEAEAFRSIRTNVQFANVDERPKVILITSAFPREGKSLVSSNLALAFAQAGSLTVLLDADLRRPSQHRLFGVSPAAGLTGLLTDAISLNDLRRFEVGPNLLVIPSGPLPPNPTELLSSARMSTLLASLRRITSETTVIIDSSPVLAAADAVALATKVDGTIFVVDSAKTRARASRHALEALARVRASVFGVVLNKVSDAEGGYYYYNYYGHGRPDAGRDPRRSDLRRVTR